MPRIKTTRTVNVALFLLRIYLIGMLLLILVKFVLDSRRTAPRPQETTTHGKAAAEACPRPVVEARYAKLS